MTEKLQQPKPRIFLNIFLFFFLSSQGKDSYERSSNNKELADNENGSLHFVHYVHIKPQPLYSRSFYSGILLFLRHKTPQHNPDKQRYSRGSFHALVPPLPPIKIQNLSSSHCIHCNTLHLLSKSILIA